MTDAKLFSAMAKAFPKIEGAIKDTDNPAFKRDGKVHKYADLASVVAAIKPALAENGLFFSQIAHEHEGGVCIETMVGHESGEHMSFGKLFVPASKHDAQGYGSALTYCRRYSLMAAFGVCPEDDDGNAAAASAPKQAKADEGMPSDAWAKLVQLGEASGTQVGELIKRFGVKNLRLLAPKQYDEAIELMTSRLAEKAKAETDKDFGEILDDEIPGFS